MPWNVWSLTENRWLMLVSVASKQRAQAAIEGFLGENHPASSMEPRRVLGVLEQHGTTLMQFKPEAIWNMAMTDLRRRTGNATADVSEMHHYHFHRDHVRKAKTANDILRAAIEDIGKGRESGKKVTRLLYADEDLLRKALR
jgi:plasmid stabilization system protein ParE